MNAARLIRKILAEKAAAHKETFVKFVAVGASATLVTLGLLWFFTEVLRLYYVWSGALSGQLSIFWSFILHDNWTWGKKEKQKGLLGRFLAFEGIYVSSIVANTILLYFFTDYFRVPYLLSMMAAIGITFMFNYFMHSKITFKPPA